MPSASAETDAKMLALFGPNDSPIAGDEWILRAMSFLEEAGYVEHKGGWKPKPGVEDLEDMTDDEWTCMAYLIEEWDFGALTTEYSNAE